MRWRAVLAVPGALCLGACSALWGFDDLQVGDGGAGADASIDASADGSLDGSFDSTSAQEASNDAPSDTSRAPDGGADGPTTCSEFFPPPKPAMDDPSDAGDQSFVVALHTLDIGLGDGGVNGLGYDLDGVYTHATMPACGPESCKAVVTGATHPDGLGGRDDYAGQFLAVLASLDPSQFNATSISQRLQQGTYSILLQILHYNGQPNDTQVTAALYASLGMPGDAGAQWNGSDPWTIDESFVVGSPDASPILPTHFDGTAYVSGGTLVIHVNFPITIGATSNSSFAIDLTAGVITGIVSPAGSGTYALRAGQIAGRWNMSDLLGALQSINYLGSPICQGSSTYSVIKGQVCQYADIMIDPAQDNMGNTCDAVSTGIGFTADPALLGSVIAPPPPTTLCEAGVGAEPDTCGP